MLSKRRISVRFACIATDLYLSTTDSVSSGLLVLARSFLFLFTTLRGLALPFLVRGRRVLAEAPWAPASPVRLKIIVERAAVPYRDGGALDYHSIIV